MGGGPEGRANQRIRFGGEFPQVLLDFLLLVAPREVAVRLMESYGAQAVQHRGSGEGLREEDDLGVLLAELRQQALPEGHRLGVRVIHAEDRYAMLDPELENAEDLLVDALRVVIEVQGVDILVLLRRILGEGDGSVGAGGEPLRVLLEPRMVRRTLEGQINGHFHAVLACPCDKVIEVLEGTQFGMDGVVAAVG